MILDINIFPGISPFQYYSSLSFHYKTILQWKIHMEIQSPTHVKSQKISMDHGILESGLCKTNLSSTGGGATSTETLSNKTRYVLTTGQSITHSFALSYHPYP